MRFTWRRRADKPRPLRKIALLPTLITLGNAVCGVLAVMECVQKRYENAAWLIFAGMVFDALDGKVARATGTASAFGAQLDSLCDAVSFGVAPAVMVWAACSDPKLEAAILPVRVMTAACIFYCVAAIIRLARFNIETDTDLSSHLHFTGLPSPAAAAVIAATFALAFADEGHVVVLPLKALPVAAFFIGVLMISRIRYPHLINRLLTGFSPMVRLAEILLVVVVGIALKQYALFVLAVGYALAGPVFWVARRLVPAPPAPLPAPPVAEPPAAPAPPPEEEPLF